MKTKRLSSRIVAGMLGMLAALSPAPATAADVLAEFLFWDSMGRATGQALSSLNDYRKERQKWQSNIAAAKAELKRCGGCASAQAELKKWQKIESEFDHVAGGMAQAVGMPPKMREWLDIPTVLTTPPPEEASLRQLDEAWLAKKPDYCQAAIRKHMQCLSDWQTARKARGRRTISYGMAKVPGGACFQSSRFFTPCASGDYDGYDREMAILEARRKGHIVPQIVGEGTVYYGEVPDDFAPNLPPLEKVREIMSTPDTFHQYDFLMSKATPGRLVEFSLTLAHHGRVAPMNRCFTISHRPGEIEKRVCDDLKALSFMYSDPVIYCFYKQGDSRVAFTDFEFKYWYGERPAHATLPPLLRRSQSHPIAQVGDPRTSCPETLEAARAVNKTYAQKLAALSQEHPQASEGVVLDPPAAWQEEQRKRQEAYDKGRHGKIVADLKAFPLAGYYSFSSDSRARGSGTCEIASTGADAYSLSCKDRRKKPFSGEAALTDKGLLVRWSDGDKTLLRVSKKTTPPVLSGTQPDQPADSTYRERFTRRGDYSPEQFAALVSKFPLPDGNYRMALSHKGETAVLACVIKRDTRRRPNRILATCSGKDKASYETQLHPYTDGLRTYLRIHSWYPTRPKVAGKGAVEVRFPIDLENMPADSIETLQGSAGFGFPVTLSRGTGDGRKSDATPLDALPEINAERARRLRRAGITSLEQFAALSREEADKFGMGWAWRHDKARAFLAARTKGGGDAGPATETNKAGLEACPKTMRRTRPAGRLECLCSAGAFRGAVYGTDIYTDDSSVCLAALHAGVTTTEGGPVILEVRPGEKRYPASARNGVRSKAWKAWKRSFVFVEN